MTLGILFISSITIAQQGALEAVKKGFNMAVLPRRGIMKHDFVLITIHGPKIRLPHLARGRAPRLDRGLIHKIAKLSHRFHGQHFALQHMGRLRLYDRLQQINRLSRPVRQTAPADLDAAIL